MLDTTIFLIEWCTKSLWSEIGPGKWEVDHNGGIWFTREAAEINMKERLDDSGLCNAYKMRVAEYRPSGSLTRFLA